jgi:hypothetical protein
MITAFSREGSKKVYVQHKLKERAKEINDLLEKKAYIYVCGDAANMAREVNTILAQILAEQRGISEAKAEEVVKNMRAANQYQVCETLHCRITHTLGQVYCCLRAAVSLINPRMTEELLLTCNRRMFGHDPSAQIQHQQRISLDSTCMDEVFRTEPKTT